MLFPCCHCREVLAHLLLGRGQGGSGWAWCPSTLGSPAHVQGLDLNTALCPVASGDQGNLGCSSQAPHPAQPALGTAPSVSVLTWGISSPAWTSAGFCTASCSTGQPEPLCVHLPALWRSYDELSGSGVWVNEDRYGVDKEPHNRKGSHTLSVVTASMGGMSGWCTDWALCMCLRTLNAKTPMGAWGLRWQCSSPLSAWCTVKSSDSEGELYCWNKHGNCSLAPPHRRILCVQANGLSVLEGYVCFLAQVTEEKEIEHLVAADLVACECRISHWQVIVLLPEWSTDPVVMP